MAVKKTNNSKKVIGEPKALVSNSQIKKEANGNIVLTIKIKNSDIKKSWQEEIDVLVKNTTLPGFRKGAAPINLVLEKIDKEKTKEEILKKLLPNAYIKAVEENKLKPIVSPKIHIEKLEDPQENSDWTFEATICEAPNLNLGQYKDAVRTINAKNKIIIPGKENKQSSLDEILDALLKAIKVQIPELLITTETEKLLAQLLSEIKKLGLTLDQYLASSNKTIENLKNEYQERAKNYLSIEFALAKIAEDEKISVDPKELEEALNKAQNEEEKKRLQNNLYLLAGVLRQQKTLDFLKNL